MQTAGSAVLDKARLERLYVDLERPMYNVVYRWLWDSAEAHDVVQETFVKLWQMRSQVAVETVRPLAYRIAVNLASNRRRWFRLRRWVSLEQQPDEPAGANGTPEDHLQQAAVRRAIDHLPERYRRVILLCDFSGMTYAQVGEALRIPAGTVGSRRSHALGLLRQALGDFDDHDE